LTLQVFCLLCYAERFWKILVIPVLQILENTGYTSIADIGRLGRIQVNPSFYVYIILKELNIIRNDQYLLVLQILENSGRYWDTSIYQYLYQYCRYWKILVIPVLQILEDSGKYW
jgi:hypothetical protein